MARSGAERMAEFRKRRQTSGLVPVLVYVPEGRAADIRALAAELQEDSSTGAVDPKRRIVSSAWLASNADEPQKAALQLASKIIRTIVAMDWPVGRVIGDENELIRRYSVGRGTFREAIRLLEHHGVARMKRGIGGGLIVTEPSLDGTIYAARIYLEYRKVAPSEFLPLRHNLEQMALDRAMDRLDDAGKKRLAELIEWEESQDEPTPSEFQRFNRLITELAGDPAIILFMSILYDLTLDRSELQAPTNAATQVRTCHREIVDAMLAGDRQGAKAAMYRLFDLVEFLLCEQAPLTA